MYGQMMPPIRPAEVVMPTPMFLTTVGISSAVNMWMQLYPQETPIFPERASACNTTVYSERNKSEHQKHDVGR